MNDDITQQKQNMQNLIENVLQKAKEKGATDVELGCSFGRGLDVNVRMGEVDTLEYQKDKEMSLSVYIGKCKGSASTTDFSEESIKKTVQAAVDIAKYTSEDEYSGLADKNLLCKAFKELDLYHPWDVTAKQATEIAKECEQAALDNSQIENSEGASVSAYEGLGIYANSNDFLGFRQSTRHSIGCSVIAEDEQGMQRDYWYSSNRNQTKLESALSIGKKAAARTIKRLGSKTIKTMEVPVIYHAEVAKGLIGNFTSAISGGALYRKASFLQDSKGQQVFPDSVSIVEDPFILGAFGSKDYDSEGVTTKKRNIVTDGVVQDYFLSSYSARKLGLATTANAGGMQNLVVSHGEQSLDDLIKDMGTGLLLTELMGMGVNNITGDYSRGAAGFWVENGEILYPVDEFTVASNLKDMFKGIASIANDVDDRDVIRTGSILIDRMTVAAE
jgi:PmbA protein